MVVETGVAIAISAAVAVSVAALATAWAQSSIGAAAMGLLAERPELESKMLIYIALPETIVVLGFVISAMLIVLMGGSAH